MLMLGTASAVITPPDLSGLTLDGMPRQISTQCKLEDLEIHLFLLQGSGAAAVLCVIDRLFIPEQEHARLQSIVNKLLPGTPLMLCATHSHSATASPFGAPSPEALEKIASILERIESRFTYCMEVAMNSMRAVEVAAARIPLSENTGSNRRAKMSNGTCASAFAGGPFIPPGQRWVAMGGPDPEVFDALVFREPGKEEPYAILTAYASHIHFYEIPYLNGEGASAARHALHGILPDVHFAYTVSCPGDIALRFPHPIPHDEESSRIEWQKTSSKAFGVSFAKALTEGLAGLQYTAAGHLQYTRYLKEGPWPLERMLVETLRVGDHALCTIPGEVSLQWEAEIRDGLACESLMLIGYNSSWIGYVATPLGFEEGSYETMRGPANLVGYSEPNARVKSGTKTGEQMVTIARSQVADLFQAANK